MKKKKQLLFISPRFLFPADSGGKIRTSQILRGMKGDHFEITLASPLAGQALNRYQEDIDSVSDRFIFWRERPDNFLRKISRIGALASRLPVSVASDNSSSGKTVIREALVETKPDIVVFDFIHSAVLKPQSIDVPTLMFTHNVECEIFQRHANIATNRIKRLIWQEQYKKMLRFEHGVIDDFDGVVAVSDRDKKYFENNCRNQNIHVINTGVDLDFYAFYNPPQSKQIVFTGSMDWLANIDGIEFLLDEVWPEVLQSEPSASMLVVGRNPPQKLLNKAKSKGYAWEFTGFVDDIRPYVKKAYAYVIPLRVGGGTRIKAYEAMAMGCPVVSTTLGVEGLAVRESEHYLKADTARTFAKSIVDILSDAHLRNSLSQNARQFVEQNCSFQKVANQFEQICLNVARQS